MLNLLLLIILVVIRTLAYLQLFLVQKYVHNVIQNK